MRILFALPGLHRHDRGAEIAFMSLATELAQLGCAMTLMGSGQPRPDTAYHFLHAGALRRERFEHWPKLPFLRGDTSYEEASFIPALLRRYRPADFDLTMTCSFPFVHWALRRGAAEHRPAHVFVTQNGDWPVTSDAGEFRFFGCDGLVCTNPDYYESGRSRWPAALIPNGVDLDRFLPGLAERQRFGLPAAAQIVLMVSALIPSKRVLDGVRATAALPGVHLVCAGDGPEREAVDALARELMPKRFTRLSVHASEMPALYRSADTFLHLSLDEPFGNVFIEALSCGVPVVAQDSSRTRWIVGDDQYLCNTTDSSELVAALGCGLAASDSGRQARRERAQQFAWSSVAKQYLNFFEQVMISHVRK